MTPLIKTITFFSAHVDFIFSTERAERARDQKRGQTCPASSAHLDGERTAVSPAMSYRLIALTEPPFYKRVGQTRAGSDYDSTMPLCSTHGPM